MIEHVRTSPGGQSLLRSPYRDGFPRYIAYGLAPQRVHHTSPSFDLLVTPPGVGPSFLDFDGVILYAGTFLISLADDLVCLSSLPQYCRPQDPAELNRRHKEATTLLATGKTVIFLVPELDIRLCGGLAPSDIDLFTRMLGSHQIAWSPLPEAEQLLDVRAAEFNDFLSRYGTACASYRNTGNSDDVCVIAEANLAPVGLVVGTNLFILPSNPPRDPEDAATLATSALSAVRAYQERVVAVGPMDAREAAFIPPESQPDLVKALSRLVAGDESGAISAACGAVDSITQALYAKCGLGPPPTSFQTKVNTLIHHLKVWEELRTECTNANVSSAQADELIDHMKDATNHAAHALQGIRRMWGDVHGSKPATRRAAYDAIKWASAICGLLHGR